METKSRYEVISDLESKKRDLILERDGFKDEIIEKEKTVTALNRQKNDTIIILDRQIEDATKDETDFKATVEERKITITELIKSITESLERFAKIQK